MWWIVLVIFATAVVRSVAAHHLAALCSRSAAAHIATLVCQPDLSQCKAAAHNITILALSLTSRFLALQVVSVITFLLQWGGCCVQRTDHTGTHLRVQLGWGYAFDMHPGRRMLDGMAFAMVRLANVSVLQL